MTIAHRSQYFHGVRIRNCVLEFSPDWSTSAALQRDCCVGIRDAHPGLQQLCRSCVRASWTQSGLGSLQAIRDREGISPELFSSGRFTSQNARTGARISALGSQYRVPEKIRMRNTLAAYLSKSDSRRPGAMSFDPSHEEHLRELLSPFVRTARPSSF